MYTHGQKMYCINRGILPADNTPNVWRSVTRCHTIHACIVLAYTAIHIHICASSIHKVSTSTVHRHLYLINNNNTMRIIINIGRRFLALLGLLLYPIPRSQIHAMGRDLSRQISCFQQEEIIESFSWYGIESRCGGWIAQVLHTEYNQFYQRLRKLLQLVTLMTERRLYTQKEDCTGYYAGNDTMIYRSRLFIYDV